MTKPAKWLYAQRRFRSAWAVRTKKPWVLSYPLSAQRRLIRLGRCPGWSESSLGAHAILLVLSWGGSYSSCEIARYDRWALSFYFIKIFHIEIAWSLNVKLRMLKPTDQGQQGHKVGTERILGPILYLLVQLNTNKILNSL